MKTHKISWIDLQIANMSSQKLNETNKCLLRSTRVIERYSSQKISEKLRKYAKYEKHKENTEKPITNGRQYLSVADDLFTAFTTDQHQKQSQCFSNSRSPMVRNVNSKNLQKRCPWTKARKIYEKWNELDCLWNVGHRVTSLNCVTFNWIWIVL